MHITRIVPLLLMGTALISTSPALAHGEGGQSIKVKISASVSGRCGIEASGLRTNEGARLDRPTTVSFGFTLDCNMPFRIGVATLNGGLTLDDSQKSNFAPTGFATQKPYTVGLKFATDEGGLADAGICTADRLTPSSNNCAFFAARPGEGFSPGEEATAINRAGALELSWVGADDEPTRFVAGNYTDVITVVVGPRI